jgi:hypothetical protein
MAATDVHIVVHRSSSSHNGSFPAKSYQGVSRPPSLHSSASISIIGSLDIRGSGLDLWPPFTSIQLCEVIPVDLATNCHSGTLSGSW